MKKSQLYRILLTFLAISMVGSAYAQNIIRGKVVDSETLDPVVGATIMTVQDASNGTTTNTQGYFEIATSSKELRISFIGYSDETVYVKNSQDQLIVKLHPQSLTLSDVVVVGQYAVDRKTPIASSTIWASEISSRIGNQEFVDVFKYTPGVHPNKQGGSWSDSEIYMRGFDNTNIAVMINGIPVNDLETRSVYWSNWASISDVAAVVQTQRGLGASKVSNPSVGGTINIVTKSSSIKKSGTFVYGIGADGYNKAQLSLNSGLLKNGWSFSLSGGRTWGNGYARGTSFDAYNYFVNISKLFKGGHELKLTAFGSPQHHYMRSNALTMDEWEKVKKYNTNNKHWDRFNPDYGTDKYGNRKSADYNVYHAPFVILNHSWQINEKSNLSTSIYATFGSGYGHSGMANSDTYSSMDWYGALDGMLNNTFRGADGSVDYGKIQDINVASQTGSQLILAKQKNVNTSTGAIVCYSNEFAEKWRFNVGLDARYFKARHTYEILDLFAGEYYIDPSRANVAIENNSVANVDSWRNEKLGVGDVIQRDYDAVIVQEGVFSQIEYSTQRISAFISGALNYSHYWRYDRFYYDANHAKSQVVNYLGGNVKAGVNYNINHEHNIFANLGYISNVPKFKNGAFMSANTSHAVNPDAKNEQILSAELGYGFHNSWLDLKFNGYITNWKDKAMFKKGSLPNKEQYVINMTGVDALHMGLELEAFIRPTRWLNIAAMVSIGDWRWNSKSVKGYAYDLYGNAITTDGTITSVGASDHAWASINMANVPVGGSAQTTAALELIFKPYKDLYLAIGGTVYDRNYAYYSFSGSNLSLGKELSISEPWVIPTYATMDVRLGYTFDIKGLPVTLSGGVNNLLDNHYIEKAWDPSNISKSSSLPDPSKVYLFYSIGRTWNLSLKFQF